VAELVAAYEAGASTYELAARFSIRRETVTMHLQRAGLEIRPGPQVALDEAGERRVATLYRDGLSMRSIARQMGISDNTVLKALRAQGVPSRPRLGGMRRDSV
jgi:DNA-binding CsgD family transcriptional regulator